MALAAPFPAARPTRPVSRTTTRPAARSTRSSRSTRPTESAGLRLTRRGRAAVILASTLALFGVVVVSGLVTAEAGGAASGPAASVVVVQPGETLWQIAKSVAPQADPRATVLEIRELNGLDAEAVVPGQSLVVPVS